MTPENIDHLLNLIAGLCGAVDRRTEMDCYIVKMEYSQCFDVLHAGQISEELDGAMMLRSK